MSAQSNWIPRARERSTTLRSRSCDWATGSADGRDTRRDGSFAKCTAGRAHLRSQGGMARSLHGERVLLHAEQGLGDTIQFCRYAALVAARGGVPMLEVQPAAERLMRSLAVVRAGLAETAVMDASRLEFDLECPLMSLPAVLGQRWRRFRGREPIWARMRSWCARSGSSSLLFGPMGDPGLRVGIRVGGKSEVQGRRCAIDAVEIRCVPLLRAVDANWISLQKGEAAGQLASLPDDVFVAGRIERRARSCGDCGADGDAGPGDHDRHVHRAPGRRDGQAGVDFAAASFGLALDGSVGANAVVSDGAAVPAARGGRLGGGGGASERPRFASRTWIVSVESAEMEKATGALPLPLLRFSPALESTIFDSPILESVAEVAGAVSVW